MKTAGTTSRSARGLAAILIGTVACQSGARATPERRAEVAQRGATVMPFDLSKTHHVFESLPDGGLQTVTANEPGDTLQVRLIQEHLKAEAERFSRGDFDDPMTIHGPQMPGIAELRRGFAGVSLAYSTRSDGAAIRYTSTDASLVDALHRWFEAQRMDHGT